MLMLKPFFRLELKSRTVHVIERRITVKGKSLHQLPGSMQGLFVWQCWLELREARNTEEMWESAAQLQCSN